MEEVSYDEILEKAEEIAIERYRLSFWELSYSLQADLYDEAKALLDFAEGDGKEVRSSDQPSLRWRVR